MKHPPIAMLALLLFAAAPVVAAPVDYLRDVKPLLTQHCVSCHGPQKQRGGLRLDSAAGLREGGNSGPVVVAGKSGDSLLVKAVTGVEGVVAMPPKGPRLTAAEVAVLRSWIDAGAAAPKDEAVATANKSPHWAFRAPVRHPVPRVASASSINPIDAFILQRLAKDGIRPSPEADRATLLRRLAFDLTGLPPTPQEIDSFLSDNTPNAYERQVERLLASPHYGERWGRWWLDQARYADSNGYSIDAARSIWPYRDWVVNALNADLPFARFTIEQLAGDLLPGATPEQRVATGFHRNTQINQEGGIDVEQFRVEAVVDRVNTTGAVWLGLTVGCCQCHDHKFDPLAQREYYQLFAFFNGADEPTLELGSPEQVALRKQVRTEIAQVQKRLKPLDPTSAAGFEKWENALTTPYRKLLPADVQALLELPPNGRTPEQLERLNEAYRHNDTARHVATAAVSLSPLTAALHAYTGATRLDLDTQLTALKKREPQLPTSLVMQERKTPRPTHVMLQGDFTRKGAPVTPGTFAVLHPSEKAQTRLDLANWLVDPNNPLTGRVVVNRVWGVLFGVGLVETENDFGTQGTPPSHPELLDWLATEFQRQGGSLKALHRLLATSATYRQSSKARSDLTSVDARNRLLARQNRLRLDAELVRDAALAASGLLTRKVGGPSVFPPQPEGVYRLTQIDKNWKPSAGPERYRRGLYTHFWRSAPHPSLTVFDAPDASCTCTRRHRSNTPLQALTLLNDAGQYELAQALAVRLLREEVTEEERVGRAFRVCLGRSPKEREAVRLRQVVDAAGGGAEGWTTAARVLLNLDEFITRE